MQNDSGFFDKSVRKYLQQYACYDVNLIEDFKIPCKVSIICTHL